MTLPIIPNHPVGTRSELLAHGLDPKHVPCCGPQTEEQLGCGFYHHNPKDGRPNLTCMFRRGSSFVRIEGQFRDNIGKDGMPGAGPGRIGFFRRIPGFDATGRKLPWQGFVMTCWEFMSNEYELYLQRHTSGVEYRGFYFPGDKVEIKRRVHVPLHPTPDKNCRRCQQNNCNRSKVDILTLEFTEFPRLGEYVQPGDEIELPEPPPDAFPGPGDGLRAEVLPSPDLSIAR